MMNVILSTKNQIKGIIEDINEIYLRDKDNLQLLIDLTKVPLLKSSDYRLEVETDIYGRKDKPIVFYKHYSIAGEDEDDDNYAKFQFSKRNLWMWMASDSFGFNAEVNYYLKDDDWEMLNPDLREEILFYDRYIKILEEVFSEYHNQPHKIPEIFEVVKRLRKSGVLSYEDSVNGVLGTTLIINDVRAERQRVLSTSKYASLIISDYLKSHI